MKKLILAAAISAFISVPFTQQSQAETVRINMPSTFPGSLIQLGQAGVRLQNTLNLISGGELKIKLYEPKALVPPLEIFDAVASGSVDAGWI